MNNDSKKARTEYMQKYREENREKIKEKKREWAKNNPDKVKVYQERYWNKKALISATATNQGYK